MGGKAGPTAAGAGGGALSGAAAGSVFGPIGTAVGALAGGLGGAFLAKKASQSIAPTPPPELPVDPNLVNEQNHAAADQIRALQVQAQGDTASIMSRYGARLALAGTTPPGAG